MTSSKFTRAEEDGPSRLLTITPDAQELILYIARASSNQENTDVGLLKFLVREKHWSPYMHAFATGEFVTSRTIAHQMIRHWTLACLEAGDIPGIQEFSQRYAKAGGTIKYKARRQAEKNRQSSVDDLDDDSKAWFYFAQVAVENFTSERYEEALLRGIAKECARFLLPEATETRLYLSGSIRSWLHFLHDRVAETAQLEIQELVAPVNAQFAVELPVVWEALGLTPA